MKISKTVLNNVAKMNREELIALNRHIVATLNSERKVKQAAAKAGLSVGDAVSFRDKIGNRVRGSVTKINRVNIVVKTANCTWNVSPGLLTKV